MLAFANTTNYLMAHSEALAQWRRLHMVLAPGSSRANRVASLAAWRSIQKLQHWLSSRLPLKAFCGCCGNSLFQTFSIIESCVFVPDSTASTKRWLCRSNLVGRGRGAALEWMPLLSHEADWLLGHCPVRTVILLCGHSLMWTQLLAQ